jgi:hypothetical protein
MSDIKKYTPLMQIVSYALDELGKSNYDQDRCWVLALRSLVVMNYSFAAEPKTLRIPKNGNQTVTIPPDCLSWTKIGILNDNGEVCTVKINNALTTFDDLSPNRIERLTPDINNSIGSLANTPFYSNYYYNGGYANLFGVGGGLIQYGECRVDERNGVVILNPHFKYDSIIFEYLSSPEKDDDYKVDTCLQEAIIAFIKWKLNKGSRQDWIAAQIEGRRSIKGKKVTLQGINQVIRESEAQKLRS